MMGYEERSGEHRGVRWSVWATEIGYRCGYVLVPTRHPWHRIEYGSLPRNAHEVHGGLTYSGKRDGEWWIGFDCAHSGEGRDQSIMPSAFLGIYRYHPAPGKVWFAEDVERECKWLCEAVADVQSAEEVL